MRDQANDDASAWRGRECVAWTRVRGVDASAWRERRQDDGEHDRAEDEGMKDVQLRGIQSRAKATAPSWPPRRRVGGKCRLTVAWADRPWQGRSGWRRRPASSRGATGTGGRSSAPTVCVAPIRMPTWATQRAMPALRRMRLGLVVEAPADWRPSPAAWSERFLRVLAAGIMFARSAGARPEPVARRDLSA